MKISLIQAPIVWDNPIANILYFQQKIMEIDEETALIVLPEMFTSGFTMEPFASAENMNGETISWLKKIAETKKVAITGSLIIFENNHFYNRMVFVYPSGKIDYYDKRHLFTLAGENKIYELGTTKKVIKYMGWKICLQICYDLRFPRPIISPVGCCDDSSRIVATQRRARRGNQLWRPPGFVAQGRLPCASRPARRFSVLEIRGQTWQSGGRNALLAVHPDSLL